MTERWEYLYVKKTKKEVFEKKWTETQQWILKHQELRIIST